MTIKLVLGPVVASGFSAFQTDTLLLVLPKLERARVFETLYEAWKASILPLNYARKTGAGGMN